MQQFSQYYDEFLWALCVWREARGEKLHTSRLAVAHVVLNRALDLKQRWPKTPSGVVLQHLQFSSFNAGDPNATLFPARDATVWLDCCDAVAGVLAGDLDPTKGANHYHSKMPTPPAWADPSKLTAEIGGFRFFKL
jgi:spore germination cell wall hydrolase CwlJ-like protein